MATRKKRKTAKRKTAKKRIRKTRAKTIRGKLAYARMMNRRNAASLKALLRSIAKLETKLKG